MQIQFTFKAVPGISLLLCFVFNFAQAQNPVVINELMASNQTTVADQDGEFDDWIELYNNSASTVSLDGWHLTDTITNLTKYDFPAGTTIGGYGYLIVWADEDGMQAGLHANFKLSASMGEELYLTDAAGNIVQTVIFGTQQADKGYARSPNGTGNFIIKNPTFNSNNDGSTPVDERNRAGFEFSVFPNPARQKTVVKFEESVPEKVSVYNAFGQKLMEEPARQETILDCSYLPKGLYFVQAGGQSKTLNIQ